MPIRTAQRGKRGRFPAWPTKRILYKFDHIISHFQFSQTPSIHMLFRLIVFKGCLFEVLMDCTFVSAAWHYRLWATWCFLCHKLVNTRSWYWLIWNWEQYSRVIVILVISNYGIYDEVERARNLLTVVYCDHCKKRKSKGGIIKEVFCYATTMLSNWQDYLLARPGNFIIVIELQDY